MVEKEDVEEVDSRSKFTKQFTVPTLNFIEAILLRDNIINIYIPVVHNN